MVNTVISDKVPNYLNTAFKQEIIQRAEPYKGPSHNLVILDPIYRAFTFGSTLLEADEWNEEQLKNKLVIVHDRNNKFSQTYVKKQVVSIFTNYFNSLTLGESVDVAYLTTQLYGVQGLGDFYIENVNGSRTNSLTFYSWNPLYCTDDW